jgi:amino acid transporter
MVRKAGLPQVLSLGFSSFGWVSTLVSLTIFGVAARQFALMSIYFAGNSRLPMVAGWDNLLPGWFARLHKRHRRPVNSILFVGSQAAGSGLYCYSITLAFKSIL